MNTKLLVLAIPGALLLAACGAATQDSGGANTGPPANQAARTTSGSTAGSASLSYLAPAPAKAGAGAAAPAPAAQVPPLPSAQHLEINALLTIQIPRDKFQDDYGQVLRIVEAQRGYLSASDTSTSDGGPRSGTFTFQVPVDAYMAVINQLHGIGKYSEHSTSKPHDSEYVDLQARLKSAQAQLAALNGLLAKAGSIGDIIAIEQQIGPVQQQIEEYQGQLQYLDSLTQYATVTVTLTEKGVAPPQPVQPGFADTFRQVLHNLAAMANGFILVIGTLLPFIVLAAAAIATRRRWLPVFART